MTITTDEFVSTFHSLSGITIGEKRKNLFLLLKQIQDPQKIDFSSIQPKTRLEESFRVEIFLYFRKIPELVEVLKTENPILIEKILKASSWFLKQALETISEEDLVNHIFPALSFNAKVKVLNKLSFYLKNTEQADRIFNAVKEKYGNYLAAKLLPCCSGNTIINCIKSARVELTPRQLLMIVKTYPELTESILQILDGFSDKHVVKYKYENVFKYVLQNDLLLFLKLRTEFQPNIRLGWRATDKLVIGNKENIIENADIFYKLLHKKQIIKSVSQDFNTFYLNLLPKSLDTFKGTYNFYFDLIPIMKVHKIDLVVTTFKKKYGDDLWNDPECVTPGLLELMDIDEREAWMQTHERPKNIPEDSWICLMKIDKSIPALKKRISSVSKIKERAGLVACLVETCRINNDKASLLEVCKYTVMQHRNDKSDVIICFLKTLKNCFNLNSLDDEHWKYINEMVQMNITKGLIPYYYHQWLFDYIGYRLKKKLPIKKELKDISTKIYAGNLTSHQFPSVQDQKQYLLEIGEIVPELFEKEESQHNPLQLLSIILKWNRKNPKNQILSIDYKNLLINTLELMKGKLEGYQYSYMLSTVLSDYIRTGISESEKITIFDFYYTKKNISIEMNLMEWLIKYEPCLILRYINEVTNNILEMWYTLIKPFFWRHCNNYYHLEIPQKITSICLQIIQNSEESDSRKKNAINALSFLMPPKDFLNLVEPYYPSELVMDVNNEENQETYKIQQAITVCLKNVIPPSCTLQSVLNFSKGDYLKFIQRSLSSVSHNVAEEKLPFLFLSLSDRAVSVRKHAIYQTFKVMDKNEIFKMLKIFMEKEKNSSIRKFLFKGIFNYFCINPDDHLWELVKENVKAVDINDEEAFTTLMEFKKIPPMFLAQYLTFTWELLETLPNPQKFNTGKCQLLDAVSPTIIPNLNKEFCLGIIQRYLFKSADLQNEIYIFTCKFVMFSLTESEQEERLKTIFEILKEYINTTWHKSGTKTTGRNFIFNFLKTFCSFFQEKKCLVKNILVKFIELWNNFLKPHDAFEEYLHLEFTLIYVDFVINNLSLPQVGQKFANFGGSLLGIYGNSVINIFCTSLNSHIRDFLNSTDDFVSNSFILIESIITASNSTNCFIMAVYLLPQDIPITPKLKMGYNKIMSLLEKNSDILVQLSLSFYFKNIASQVTIDIPTEKRRYSGRKKESFWSVCQYDSKYKK